MEDYTQKVAKTTKKQYFSGFDLNIFPTMRSVSDRNQPRNARKWRLR